MIRPTAAVFAGIAAIAWILERALGFDNPVGRVIDAGLGHAPWLLAGLTALALLAFAAERRPTSPHALG